MRYSVWNYRDRRFDYYDAPMSTLEGTHVGAPPTPLVRGRLGATPDQAAWRLPVGARKVGSGSTAEGKVASLGDDTIAGAIASTPAKIIGAGVIAYLLLRKR